MMGHLVFGRYGREAFRRRAKAQGWRAWLAANFGRKPAH